ncbi:Ig-like domain-containing protein [Aeromicrobium fastidiosum]|uniref:Ig-like domain-containing protein n=1 Tax=Aeromicrobium fastidiosum TaxID=52699 RepID=UPI002023746A|nr:Ig-like domain-containing protein [Aeromicrobium fastidiosum]MCL8253315.1 Ig-like domain-containing protein [Aeromicrobium fastidiosum]
MKSTTPRHREVAARTHRLPLLVVALLVVVAAVAMTGSSSASFVASTGSTGTVSAAADWTPPTVAVTAPAAGTAVKGTVSVTASATDADSGVATVTVQRAAAGTSTWTTICTTSTAPYTCSWSTTALADGGHDLRAVAVDKAGNSATSASVRTTVANNLTVVLARPGDILRGNVTTTTTVSDAGSLTPSVRVEYAPAGTTTWTTLCTAASAPYTCSASTTSLANGTYDLRSVAVAGGTTYASATVAGVVVDNLAPSVTMTDPGSPLKGTKTFAASASDAHSGVAKVVVQASTGSGWSDLCTVSSAPYSCSVDTTTLTNGTYSFRAVATDRAGNSTTSAVVANRVVQNTVSSVTLTAPGAYLKGSVTLNATATSTGTIASVRIQRSVAGAGTWTDICTDTTSPYSCSFATPQVADGTYDLRAVVTDSDGLTTPSAVVTNRVVDNTPGKGVDIQTTNGGTAGRIDAGDTVVFTFSEQMDLSSIYSGWSGSATSGTQRVRGGLFSTDVMDISAPTGVRLGTVDLNANFATIFADALSDVSISAATVTVDGVARTVVTVRVLTSSGLQATTPANLVWRPSGSVLDLAGNAMSTAAVTESGPLDLDF